VPDPPVPVLVHEGPGLLDRVLPVVGKPLTFETRGLGRPRDVTLVPFFRVHHQRYTVYWRVLAPAAYERYRQQQDALGSGRTDAGGGPGGTRRPQ